MQATCRRVASVLLLSVAVALAAGRPVAAQAEKSSEADKRQPLPSIEQKTEGMRYLDGFFDLYWDEAAGKLYLLVDRWNQEFLYQISLPTGLGSNPVGLDRGQLGGTHVLRAERVGRRVLLIEPNYRFRAITDDRAEARAVEEAFAPSTHWGFEVVAETGDRALVDASDFFLRDAHGVAARLDRAGQGSFRLEKSRSAVYLPRTRAFPDNTEVEVSLTFTSERPGPLVRQTAASGEAITLRQHHSLVRLPEAGYEPREADPRVGAFGISFHDYATPIDQPLERRWVARHRLARRDPTAERSEPVEPIVYYLDRGVPEPVRSALIEGASWWNQAFEAAGYVDAFRVELLPPDADPMDLRYNLIHWTHRSTRGWSYGSTVVDPRTGEILKGNVNLGSLRLRQDHLLGVGLGLVGAQASGSPEWFDTCDLSAGPTFDYLAAVAPEADAVELALARVRQLSAHEVGHTIGLAHNFIASTYGRASVMDYPAPLAGVTADGEIDLSDAYAVGIGAYDAFAVRWLYTDFAPEVDEKAALEAMVAEGIARGIRFISDADARPPGAAHPLAHLWDNGADPVASLRGELEVRRIGLERFGETALRPGEPLASLEAVLVPLYLHHRYQVEAAARSVGGADYHYAVRGDGQPTVEIVSGARQRDALEAVLATLAPGVLALPERVLQLIPPRAFGMQDQETFASWTGPTFDPIAAAAGAANYTVGLLLQPQRMARLVEYHSRDAEYPGLEEVSERLLAATWKARPPESAYRARVAEAVQAAVLESLLREAANPRNAPAVRAALAARLDELARWLADRRRGTPHQQLALAEIRRWQSRPYDADAAGVAPDLPPGSPIGSSGRDARPGGGPPRR